MGAGQQIPIYYINLSSRADRRSFMEEQFLGLGLRANRVEAVTPDTLLPELALRASNPARYRWLTLGELSVSASHVKALEAFVEHGGPHAVILEDDVQLSRYLPEFLSRFASAPPTFDLVRIETFDERLRIHPKVDGMIGEVKFRISYTGPAGSAGYVVSRAGAQRILSSPDTFQGQIDMTLFNPFARLARQLTIRHADPGLCIQLQRLADKRSASQNDLDSHRLNRPSLERGHWRFHHRSIAWLDQAFHVGIMNSWHEIVDGAKKRKIAFRPD